MFFLQVNNNYKIYNEKYRIFLIWWNILRKLTVISKSSFGNAYNPITSEFIIEIILSDSKLHTLFQKQR